MPRFNYGCETICNENDIYPAMKILVEEEGMSETAAGKFVEKDSGGQVTWTRARDAYRTRKKDKAIATKVTWTRARDAYRTRKKDKAIATKPKPKKVQTKPKTKTALNATVKAIDAGEVSQEDVKAVTDVVAHKIYTGELPYNLAEPVTHAMNAKNPHKPKRRKKKGVTLKSIHSRINGAANDLLGYLDSGLKPQGNDINYYEGIRHSAPVLMMCFHKMGIDIDKVMATVKGKPKEVSSDPKIQPENIITVE
jgi:hypothetical protein